MPSIPQSLLWISLVVLWLFVLVPMLISKRDAVRRTSDVALATRVLNGGASARLLKRGGPAAGHRSDPHWKPEEDWAHDPAGQADDDADQDTAPVHDVASDAEVAGEVDRPGAVVMRVGAAGQAGETQADRPDYLDVEVVEESAGALPVGASARMAEPMPPAVDARSDADELAVADDTADESELDTAELFAVRAGHQERAERADDEYEYVEDSSGLEPPEDPHDDHDAPASFTPGASRRRRFDTKTAAAVSARKYAFRKRMLMAMALVLVGSAVAAFEVTPLAWWLCGTAIMVTLLYLAYLRRQTRIEEKVRRRRMHRMARARVGVENTHDRDYDVVPSRLRRPGAVVLEIDDEDPIFEHLDNAVPMRHYGWSRDLPRAVGQ
ncbi:hypothetical protein B1987_08770 [Mycobacterium kansasii]|uniref:Transmembrane protein n=1 Tax=Mycobacterium attenuatum TaxID=2341086 RepID=A0A498QES5_9MYCO|nr:gephyrin-like molybdotransferase receptor GlpR [Mycobacterium attenuatum]ORB83879.1 hypothetical protein B1987_08770 [Mycobacterium kansasii]VBA42090.1 hypothetical protein LAUMK136_04394 [Mycobacterium attenuatum]VBA58139.1 hypothetical protein LAUMK191_04388 [Mycobacterium attenuatum]VBA61130.1 hypothetical protein LAUMK41_04504 [Mycobacterium attenuatum]